MERSVNPKSETMKRKEEGTMKTTIIILALGLANGCSYDMSSMQRNLHEDAAPDLIGVGGSSLGTAKGTGGSLGTGGFTGTGGATEVVMVDSGSYEVQPTTLDGGTGGTQGTGGNGGNGSTSPLLPDSGVKVTMECQRSQVCCATLLAGDWNVEPVSWLSTCNPSIPNTDPSDPVYDLTTDAGCHKFNLAVIKDGGWCPNLTTDGGI